MLREPSAVSDPKGGNRLSRVNLLGWVNQALAEGFSEASKRERPFLFVRERDLECEIPYAVIDSTIEDVHFFSFRDSIFLGLGRAKEWEFDSGAFFRDMKSGLNLDSSSLHRSKTWMLGGWSFPGAGRYQKRKKGRSIWRAFPSSRWVIPALLFTSAEGRTHLTLAVYFDSYTEKGLKRYYAELVDGLITSLRTEPRLQPAHLGSNDLPLRKQWISLARRALETISKGRLKKVVLSRSVKLLFDDDIPCSTVLKRLIESNPESTVFAVRNRGTTFLGATPESLLSLKNRQIRVDCLAASAPRDSDSDVDELLGIDLLRDKKSRHEHQLVVQGVTKSLSRICSEMNVSENPLLKKLPTVQHLHAVVRGRLIPEVDIWSAARSIWPTPSTGGEPRDEAVRWIQKFEPASRGWYSGVVGCVNANGDGNLVVSIRSGVIRGNSALIFAGSGIVDGSDPSKEFEETGWKMGAMMKALDVEGRG